MSSKYWIELAGIKILKVLGIIVIYGALFGFARFLFGKGAEPIAEILFGIPCFLWIIFTLVGKSDKKGNSLKS